LLRGNAAAQMFASVTAQQQQRFVSSRGDFSPEKRTVCGYDWSPPSAIGFRARRKVNGSPRAGRQAE
jgi:hypothetical protein